MYFNPLEEELPGVHTYKMALFPEGRANDPIFTGEIDVWETYNLDTYAFGPFDAPAGHDMFSTTIDPSAFGNLGTFTLYISSFPNGSNGGIGEYPHRAGAIEVQAVEVVASPNLQIDIATIETVDPYFVGSSIGLQGSIKNIGTDPAGASNLGYYIASNSDGNPIDTGAVRTNAVPALDANVSSDDLYEDVHIPRNLSAGTYYAVFRADNDGDVSESNENDNKYSIPFTVQSCDTSTMYCDVPDGRTFKEDIEAITGELTNGCRSDNVFYNNAVYCPDMLLDRGSMAVFAVRQRLGYSPPLGPYQGYYADVPSSHPFALWIEKAKDEGIVNRCGQNGQGEDLFCPDYDTSGWAGIVTRANIAIFIANTEDWDLSQPTTGVFSDMLGDGYWERAAEYMYWKGYISGASQCTNTNPTGDPPYYCSEDYVNRGMAAGFMAPAFEYIATQPRCVSLAWQTIPNNGIVIPNPTPDCPIDSTQYKFDTNITLTAIPNSGYHFNAWEGVPSALGNPTSITMGRQDKLIVAHFAEGQAPPPPPTTYSISGKVTDFYGSPLTDIQLQLTGSGIGINYTFTNSNGDYSFDGLAEGRYLITAISPYAEAPYFNPASVWLNVPDDEHQYFQARFDYENPPPVPVDEIPYVHQLWSTEDNFAGWGACGPASAAMLLAWYGAVPPQEEIGLEGFESQYSWYVTNSSDNLTVPGWDLTNGGGNCTGTQFYGLNGYANPTCNSANSFQPYCQCGRYAAIWNNLGMAINQFVPVIRNGNDYFWNNGTFPVIQAALNDGHFILLGTRLGRSDGHIVLVRGYDETTNEFIVSDPYGIAPCSGPNCAHDINADGRDVRYSWADLNPYGLYIETQDTPPASVFQNMSLSTSLTQTSDYQFVTEKLSAYSGPTLPIVETLILNGGRKYSNHTDIWAIISAEEVTEFRFSFDGTNWTDWESYIYARPINLPSGDGQKTVHVELQNEFGNSTQISQTIVLDTTPPTGSLDLIEVNNGWIKYRVVADDSLGEISAMLISQNASFNDAEWGYPYFYDLGVAQSNGGTVYVKLRDQAGNVSDVMILRTTDDIFLPMIVR